MNEVFFVEYDDFFLEKSFFWLNDSEIKKLTDTNDFTKEQQIKWFRDLKYKKDYKIWGVMYNNEPIGACGLKNITNNDCEYWGYIGEKKYWGKGIGKIILKKMIDKAIELNLKSIWLKVIKENCRAINLYKKFGFIEEKEENNLIYMRKTL